MSSNTNKDTSAPPSTQPVDTRGVSNSSMSQSSAAAQSSSTNITAALSADTAKEASSSASPKTTMEPKDEAVVAYLRKRGMVSAVLELTKHLKSRDLKQNAPTSRAQLEMDEAKERNKRAILARTTGGGFGYDVDGAPSIVQWGVPDGRDIDTSNEDGTKASLTDRMGSDEARAFVDSFVFIQTWVLSLPDDPAAVVKTSNPKKDDKDGKIDLGISIASVIQNVTNDSAVPDDITKSVEVLQKETSTPWMPPSAKPELLAVTFALIVHTYCEMLEVGMEETAKNLVDTFRPVYEPLYRAELADLEKCATTEDIIRLNSQNSNYLEALATLKAIMVQVSNLKAKRAEYSQDIANSSSTQASTSNTSILAQKKRKIVEYDQNIVLLQQKHEEVTKRAELAFEKTQDLPFLRRARAVRWQLTLSSTTYGMLASFLASREMLLPMSTLLQTKCEIHVERRDPLPFTPACVLDDNAQETKKIEEVRWGAPVPPAARLAEAGEDIESGSILKQPQNLPFPHYNLEEEYDSQKEADEAKKAVEFNRALLVSGFRRLEALERKQEYEVGLRHAPDDESKQEKQPRLMAANPLMPSILLSTLCSSSSPGSVAANVPTRIDASAIWEESVVGITCAKMCPPDGRRVAAGCDDSAVRIWSIFDADDAVDTNEDGTATSSSETVKETAMVLLGHKNGFPVFDVDWNRDGRTLLSAGGDGSIRLWDTMAKGPYGHVAKATKCTITEDPNNDDPDNESFIPGLKPESTSDVTGAALAVYRGHTPSSPIWSVSFAPCGYYFASAGSDGTARLWTTDRPRPVRIFAGHTSPSVNCVTWHPNCNYILTGCDDKTVRMWDVQSGNCVRLLNGCAQGINCVTVCPSGRYAAGADLSGIVSIWDLGSGNKVNELRPPPGSAKVGSKRDASGLPRLPSDPSMIHSLTYSACGTALATGGDDCTVRIWDVRGAASHMSNPEYAASQGWGESGSTSMTTGAPLNRPIAEKRPGTMEPIHSFPTRRTLVLDLHYTKRNLLLSVGKYAAAAPLGIVS